MKGLVYTRPRIDGFYHALAREWLGESKYDSMSDHGGLEPIWIMKHFYQAQREQPPRMSQIPLDLQDYLSIALRCRYLRHISLSNAIRHINAMWIAMERILHDSQPDVIIGPVMDSYVLDVCDRVARTMDREYSGFLENMVNGYSRITSRGELRIHREPSEAEVEEALRMLERRAYVPHMQRDGMAIMGSVNKSVAFFTKYARDRAKSVYYAFKRLSDPCNFYYNTVASAQIGLACGSLAHLGYSKYESPDWENRVSAARSRGAKILYLPLQFYPEASIDYWGTSLELAQFDRVTMRMLHAADPEHAIVVKEHPAMTTFRNPSFYQRISQLENVILAPVTTPSNAILESADIVVTWTGSVGFEAAIRGRPLVTFGKAYYDTHDSFHSVQSLHELDDLTELSRRALVKYRVSTAYTNPRELVRNMLRGLLPGYVFTVDYGGARVQQDRPELQRLAASVEAYFQTMGIQSHPVHPGTARVDLPKDAATFHSATFHSAVA